MSELSAEERDALDAVLLVIETAARSEFYEFMDNRVGGFLAALAGVDPPLTVVPLAAPQPEPSAGLREAAEWLVRDALTYFPHADSVKAVQHALAAAPSPALSVERLARAFDLNDVNWPKRWGDNDFAWLARQVAAEYARLTAEDAP